MYARWIRPHISTKSPWQVGNSDVSAHRIISDLSQFIGHRDPSRHRILAAGDLNTIYGATDDNKLCIADRERTVFDRMNALGMEFMGPQDSRRRKSRKTNSPGITRRYQERPHLLYHPHKNGRKKLRINSITCSLRGVSTIV